MYRVERSDGRIVIRDWNDKVIYSVPEDSYIVVRENNRQIKVAVIGKMTDAQLLSALAEAVKLPFGDNT